MRILKTLVEFIGPVLSALVRLVARAWVGLANTRRHLFRRRLPNYVVIDLDQPLSERAPVEPWWYGYIPGRQPALSLEELAHTLQRVAADPAIRGVIFVVKEPDLTLAQAQSMQVLFTRLRDGSRQVSGTAKRIVVHLETLTAPAYVMAAGADTVTATPLTGWDVTGLRAAPLYLKETLARLGVTFDVVQIAPWKTAADMFSRADMSEEARNQLSWLLDSLFRDMVDAISQGRNVDPGAVRALVDAAPISSAAALDAGLFDHICYEDELPDLLGDGQQPATLTPADEVRGLLLRKAAPRRRQRIGVISLTGAIVAGRSRRFPLPLPVAGESTIGSTSAQQLIRAARQDDRLAAVVLHVDSGGGSALASDLIWRELELLNREKPLIVYMGNVAASGGYYIAAPARTIVAQSATLTGSIGVVTGKAVIQETYRKVGAHQAVVQRGAHAGIYASDEPWTPAQRHSVEEDVRYVYDIFKARVTAGRGLPPESLDDIANGRVWTGAQARVLGLVDDLGDFQTAVEHACRAAGLPGDGSVRIAAVTAPGDRLISQRDAPPAALLLLLGPLARRLGVPPGAAGLLDDGLLRMVRREHFWLWADGLPRLD